MKRAILPYIIKDLDEKTITLSGPRQVGKTTLSQSISKDHIYLNYDVAEHRKIIINKAWSKEPTLLILDELHKMPNWKRFLKGIYDLHKSGEIPKQKIIVTGSARLDIAKKMGDSLAGRHFSYTLNPFTAKELSLQRRSSLKQLMKYGGFPEPFLKAKDSFYRKWQISHSDLILRQDLIDLEQVKSISQIELLVELLRNAVGSPCSYTSLSEDLQVSPATVKNWLRILESLYIIFKVTPFHKNVARSILKSPKYYFYDIGRVPSEGARFENLVALALKSEIDLLKDTVGRKCNLNYLRTRDGSEVDFYISEGDRGILALGAKLSDISPEKSFKKFFNGDKLACKEFVQLVLNFDGNLSYPFGLKIKSAERWLAGFEI